MTAALRELSDRAAQSSPARRRRLAYLVTHPIQYQAPLLRLVAAQPDIDLTVFFQSDLSVRSYRDRDFGVDVKWDVSLLDGYRHEFLPAIGRRDRLGPLWPLSYGIASRLRRGRFDALWVHGYARWFNWVAMAAARLAGAAVMLRDDATPISRPRAWYNTAAKRMAFFPALSTVCDAFLATGTMNRRYYLENGVDPSRIFLVPNCVDNRFFAERAREAAATREALRRELGLEAGRPIVLFAGKLRQLKRVGDIVAALRLIASDAASPVRPYLLVVGDGEMRRELEGHAQALKGDVRFLGFRNQSELPALFDLCDVFVLSSEFETWGLAVNEAMSTGRAVVVSDRVGCAPDLVKDGVNGHVYPCGDAGRLAAALRDVLQSRERIAAMGGASAEIIAEWSFAQDVDGLRAAMDYAARRHSQRFRSASCG